MSRTVFKTLLTVPACFYAFTQDELSIVHGIIYIVILDTITGMIVGARHKRFCSGKMSRAIKKVSYYGVAMLSMWVLSSVEPSFDWAFRWLGLIIIVTEILSIFENLALLGFKLPTAFLSKINKEFVTLKLADKHSKKVIAEKIFVDKRCQ